MFTIVRDSTFDGMYDFKNDAMQIFLNHFRNKTNLECLFWFPQEFISKPFNLYNPLEKHKDMVELENLFFQNQIKMSVLYGGMDGCDVYEKLKTYNIPNLEFLYWPTFLLHYTKYNMEQKYGRSIEDINISTDFNNLFLFLNNKPKKHRGMVLDLLVKNNILNKGLFSWRETTNWWTEDFKFKYWEEKIVDLDVDQQQSYRYENYFFTDKILNSGSLINIIGESIHFNDSLFITEKTYKSILTSQPFICIGSQYQNLSLKLLGFELYDEIFDYTFDTDLNLENRVNGLVINVKSIVDQNYKSIYEKIKHKVEFNKNRALELVKKDTYIPYNLIDNYHQNYDIFENYISHGKIPTYFHEVMKNL